MASGGTLRWEEADELQTTKHGVQVEGKSILNRKYYKRLRSHTNLNGVVQLEC
jgi:hypothetical protein